MYLWSECFAMRHIDSQIRMSHLEIHRLWTGGLGMQAATGEVVHEPGRVGEV